MACVSFNLLSINGKCDNSNGGINRLWITQKHNLLYTSEMTDGGGELSNVMMFGCAEWIWRKNTASYTSELTAQDTSIGSKTFQTTINLQFTMGEANKRKAIMDVLNSGECVILIEDKYGSKLFVERAYLNNVEQTSGTALGDLNGYKLTIVGENTYLPKFLSNDETVTNRLDKMVNTQPMATMRHTIEYDSNSIGNDTPENGELFYDFGSFGLNEEQYEGSAYAFYYIYDFSTSQYKGKDIDFYFVRENENINAPLSNVVRFNTNNYDITKYGEISNLVFTLPFDFTGTKYKLYYKVDGEVHYLMTVENAWYQDWEGASYTKIEIPVVRLEHQVPVLGLGVCVSNNIDAIKNGSEIEGSFKLYYYD